MTDDRPAPAWNREENSPEENAKELRNRLQNLLVSQNTPAVVEFRKPARRDHLLVPVDVGVRVRGSTVDITGGPFTGVQLLDPWRVSAVSPFDGWGYETTRTYHVYGTPVEIRVRVGDDETGEADAGTRKVAHDNVLDAVANAHGWDERGIPDGGSEPVAYHIAGEEVSPLWCPDCNEDVKRETEPLYEEDMENFDRVTCIKCGLSAYVSEDDPGRVEIVGEIGDEDDPLTVRTEPLRNDEGAYSLALTLKMRGWRNVRGEEVETEGAIRRHEFYREDTEP